VVGLSNEIFSPLGVASVAAEPNSRELLEIVHIVISDERTSDKVFLWSLTNLHRLINGTFETMTFEWNYLI
jgi:hypothetical protein